MTQASRKIDIPWHRRLEARVLVAGVTVSGFCLAAVLLAAVEMVSQYGLRKADDQIASAKTAFDQLLLNRSTFAHTQLHLITELPVFLAVLNNSEIRDDVPTMDAMAEHYRDQLHSEACIISDLFGNPLGKSEQGATQHLPKDLRSVAGLEPSDLSIISLEGELYLIVSERAVFADEELGMMTAAYRLDDRLAFELAKMTRTEVSFLSAGHVVSSSLEPSARDHIQSLLNTPSDHTLAALHGLNSVGSIPYVSGLYPLPVPGDFPPGSLLLMDDWRPTGKLISDLKVTLFWVAVGVFGLAIAGMVVFSRRVSRHMSDFAHAARDIAAGDWQRRVPAGGSAEAALAAVAFNDMTVSLVHWHDEAETRLSRLQGAYDRFSAVTHSASDAIVSVDSSGAVLLWNPGAERLFGYSESEATGAFLHELIGPIGGAVFLECTARLSQANRADENGVSCEMEANAKGGRTLVVDLSLAPQRSGDNGGLIAVMRDATARVEVQRHLQAARETAETASRNKSAFVANMSHELRTPLNAIIGYSEMLYEEAQETGSTQAEDLARVSSAARQLLGIINDVLDFSKIEAGRMTVDMAPFNIEDLIRDVAATASPLIAKTGNRFEVVPSGTGTMNADRLRMQQVLLNLLGNAAKFTRNGIVRLSTRHEDGSFVFDVQDTGIGIAEEHIGLLFRDFSQVDASSARRHSGTGLGLAISRQICRLMGGDLTVQSVLGEGSVFTARIPDNVEPGRQADDAKFVFTP